MSGLDITRSLFLGDLSCFCTEQDVFQLFQNVGPIEEIRIMRGKDNKNLGYGFITFRDQQTANQAFRMDGCVLVGRPLKVGWAHDRNAQKFVTTPKAVAEPKGSVAQLHFSFISKHSAFVVTEATVRAIFNLFGEVLDIHFKKSVVDPNTKQHSGYGFVDYALTKQGITSAINACDAINQVLIGNVLYDCCLTHALERYLTVNYPEIPLPAPHPMGGARNVPPNLPVSAVRPLQHMNFPPNDFEPNVYQTSYSRLQSTKPTSFSSFPSSIPTTYDHYIPANMQPDRPFMNYSTPPAGFVLPPHMPHIPPNHNFPYSQAPHNAFPTSSPFPTSSAPSISARPHLSTQHLIHSFPSSQESKPPSQDSNDENKNQDFSLW